MNHSFQLDYGRKKTPSLVSEYGMCEFNMLSLNYISPLFGLYDYLLECWFVCSFIINLKLIFFLLWERRTCQQLELISKRFEKERQRFQKEIEVLRTKLMKADDVNSSLKTSMAQRASQFQIIQEDLLKKASKTSSLEREVSF